MALGRYGWKTSQPCAPHVEAWERLALLALLCHFNTDMILTQDIHNPLVHQSYIHF
jgi:hypothetical protein